VRPETLRTTYADIAKQVGLVNNIDTEQEVTEAIKEAKAWLESPDSGNWLLIFDNGDDAIDGPTQNAHGHSLLKQIHLLMPVRGNSILTTRDKRGVGTSIARYPLEITTMPEVDAVELFLNRAFGPDHFQSPAEAQAVTTLVNMLGLLPLAIDQAAGYVRTLNMPVQEYIKKLEEPAGVLSWADTNDHELLNYSASVMRTWEVSLEYVDKNLPLAGKLLRMMGFLDNECIYEDVLNVGFYSTRRGGDPPKLLESLLGESVDHDEYLRALGSLESLSLVRRGIQNDGTQFSIDYPVIWMHRLVHIWVRERMPPREKSTWLVSAVELLSHAAYTSFFPTSNSEYTYQLMLQNWNLFTAEDSIVSHRTITSLLAAERQVPLDLGSVNNLLQKIDFFISCIDQKHRITGLTALVMLKLKSLDFNYTRSFERHLDYWAILVPHLEKAAYAIDWLQLDAEVGISVELFTDISAIFEDTDYSDLAERLWWHYLHVLRKPSGFVSKNYAHLSAGFHAGYALTLLKNSKPREAAYCYNAAIGLYLDAGRERTYDRLQECLDGLLDCLEEMDDYLRIERVLLNDFALGNLDPSGFTESGIIGVSLIRLQRVMKKSQREPQFTVLLARFCLDPQTYPKPGLEHHAAEKRRRRRIQLFELLFQQKRYDFAARLLANNIERCEWSRCKNCVVFQMEPWRVLMHALCDCLEHASLGVGEEIQRCRRELSLRMDGKSKRVHRGEDGYMYHSEATDEYFYFGWEEDEGAKLRSEILGTLGESLTSLKTAEARGKLRRELQDLANTLFRKIDEPWEIDVPLSKDVVFWNEIGRKLWEEDIPDIPILDGAAVAELEKDLMDISKQLSEDLDAEDSLFQRTRIRT
jgi:hypothetical protein